MPPRRPRRPARAPGTRSSWTATSFAAWIALVGVIAIAIALGITAQTEKNTTNSLKSAIAEFPSDCTCEYLTQSSLTPTPPTLDRASWLARTGNNSLLLFRGSINDSPRLYDAYIVDVDANPPTFSTQLIPGEALPDPPVVDPNSDYVFSFTQSPIVNEYYMCLRTGGSFYLATLGIPIDGAGPLTAESLGVTVSCGPGGAYGDDTLYFVDNNSEASNINQTDGSELSAVFVKDPVLVSDALSNTYMNIIDMSYNPVTGNWWVLYIRPQTQADYGNPGKVSRILGRLNPVTGEIINACFYTMRVFNAIEFDYKGRMWFLEGNANPGDDRYLYVLPKEPCTLWQYF